jgi:hypothetical protein
MVIGFVLFLIFVKITWPKSRQRRVRRSDLLKMLDEILEGK